MENTIIELVGDDDFETQLDVEGPKIGEEVIGFNESPSGLDNFLLVCFIFLEFILPVANIYRNARQVQQKASY